jgi:hypothetical protein
VAAVTVLPETAPRLNIPAASVKIELDERCFVFPDGKLLSHLVLAVSPARRIAVDAVFPFNQTRRNPRILELGLDEARGFVRELLGAVYYAKTSFYLSDSMRVAINVAANGYHLEITRAEEVVEILLSTGSIWRFIKGFSIAIDGASPVVAN